VLKRDREIDRIREKVRNFEPCVQYALVARVDGYYPCYECVEKTIYLKAGEIWKYGKTCLTVTERYPNGLPDSRFLR